MKKQNTNETKQVYSYYSRVLEKPFDSLDELASAEATYYEQLKQKEDKAAQKKADAQKVEDAFKALNAARKSYKEDLAQLTKEYAESLENLKKAFDLGKKDIADKLAAAETTFDEALKAFQAKYENYHMTLKDGDFETTISNQVKRDVKAEADKDIVTDILKLLFGAI
jgi:predicted  nucleic acid-binding Zn-ribbon protein